jgi:hypothetical protein
MDVRAKSGMDSTDTWLKMLQNIQKCTDAVAKAIVQEYPTMYSLYEAYTQTRSVEEAEMLLADIEVTNSGDLGARRQSFRHTDHLYALLPGTTLSYYQSGSVYQQSHVQKDLQHPHVG